MRRNRVKQRLAAGEVSIGTFLALGSPLGAEQLAQVGFDWLVIDQEHGAVDATLTQYLLQAISTTDTVPLVRVPWNHPDWIKRALDAGAYGVVVPMVNSAEEAEQAVRACKYPPDGSRSVGGVRPRLYAGSDYVANANDEIAVVVQIEHIDAVRHAREILSVPGIDAYFIGPSDLSASLGVTDTWNPDFREYWEALDEVRHIARDLRVPGGIHTSGAGAAAMIERGYQFIAVGFDTSFLATAAAADLNLARAASTSSVVVTNP
jgi:4-hydroxy-2-oxoheptanedioate aldolase